TDWLAIENSAQLVAHDLDAEMVPAFLLELEGNVADPSFDQLGRLCLALGVPVHLDDLVAQTLLVVTEADLGRGERNTNDVTAVRFLVRHVVAHRVHARRAVEAKLELDDHVLPVDVEQQHGAVRWSCGLAVLGGTAEEGLHALQLTVADGEGLGKYLPRR